MTKEVLILIFCWNIYLNQVMVEIAVEIVLDGTI